MIYTPTSIQSLFHSITEMAINHLKTDELTVIQIQGEIGDFNLNSQYSILYNVKLHEHPDHIFLDIPKSLIKNRKISAGDYVKVTGVLQPEVRSNQINVKIKVSDLEGSVSPSQSETHKQNQAKVQSILSLKAGTHAFPLKENLTITVITSKNAKTEDDFLGALEQIKKGYLHYKVGNI